MILKYKGYWVKIDKEKLNQLSFPEKILAFKEYFSKERKFIAQKVKDYCIGYVEVRTQNILIMDDDESSHNEIFKVSIIAGRHGAGQWFSNIGKELAEQIVKDWEFSEKREYELHMDLDSGYGACQRYTFSKKQKDMLVEQLKPLLEKKWYEGTLDEYW